jgi:hypothetical protein
MSQRSSAAIPHAADGGLTREVRPGLSVLT